MATEKLPKRFGLFTAFNQLQRTPVQCEIQNVYDRLWPNDNDKNKIENNGKPNPAWPYLIAELFPVLTPSLCKLQGNTTENLKIFVVRLEKSLVEKSFKSGKMGRTRRNQIQSSSIYIRFCAWSRKKKVYLYSYLDK